MTTEIQHKSPHDQVGGQNPVLPNEADKDDNDSSDMRGGFTVTKCRHSDYGFTALWRRRSCRVDKHIGGKHLDASVLEKHC